MARGLFGVRDGGRLELPEPALPEDEPMLETCRLCSEHLQVGLPELGPRIVSRHRDPALRKFEETLFEVPQGQNGERSGLLEPCKLARSEWAVAATAQDEHRPHRVANRERHDRNV